MKITTKVYCPYCNKEWIMHVEKEKQDEVIHCTNTFDQGMVEIDGCGGYFVALNTVKVHTKIMKVCK